MKKSKFSEAQIVTALRQVDAGAPIPEVTRALGISEATYYVWRKQYGQLAIARCGACGSWRKRIASSSSWSLISRSTK